MGATCPATRGVILLLTMISWMFCVIRRMDSPSSALTTASDACGFKYRGSFRKCNEDLSQAGSNTSETDQTGELIIGSSCVSKLRMNSIMTSDEMDLLVEQVKLLAGEIAFSTSTLKRLVEQSVNDPESSKAQIRKTW